MNDMETQEWYEKMFMDIAFSRCNNDRGGWWYIDLTGEEVGRFYQEVAGWIEPIIAEAVSRRDAELLEKVEGMKLTMAERIAAKKTGLGIRNQTLDEVIKLIKK